MLFRLAFIVLSFTTTLLFAGEPCPDANEIRIHEFTQVKSDPKNNYWEASILGKKFGTKRTWDFFIGIFPKDFLQPTDEREQAVLAMESLKVQRVERHDTFQTCFYITNFQNINAVAITKIGKN